MIKDGGRRHVADGGEGHERVTGCGIGRPNQETTIEVSQLHPTSMTTKRKEVDSLEVWGGELRYHHRSIYI
jgi:hypothetical protein